MKIIKIGRASSNDVVLHNDSVSAYHADILILDDGKMFLTDRNSTNGTFVGKEKLAPGEETPVRRGDYVRFGDEELKWNRIPGPDRNVGCKTVVNIGSLIRNDLVLDSTFVSRVHAVLKVDKRNKVTIRDLGSKNGTLVNGVKIVPGTDVVLKRNANVICGDVDISDKIWKEIVHPSFHWLMLVACCACVAFLAVAALLLMPVKPEVYRPAVVNVVSEWHYVTNFTSNPMSTNQMDDEIVFHLETDDSKSFQPATVTVEKNGRISVDFKCVMSNATAFFIDREGNLGTNRHVAIPWKYASVDETNELVLKSRTCLEKYVLPKYRNSEGDEVIIKEVNSSKMLDMFISNQLGNFIFQVAYYQIESSGEPVTRANVYSHINRMLDLIITSPVEITGEIDQMYVGYAGRYYTHLDDLSRCYVVSDSGEQDRDVAIIQLNDKTTPSEIKKVFDIDKIREGEIEPLKETFYTIGYPKGLSFNLDQITHSLEPEIRDAKCGKVPSKNEFELQTEVCEGASGSPVFDRRGRLVGIISARYVNAATFGVACYAKDLKKLYYE